MSRLVQHLWYGNSPLAWLLWPASLLFTRVSARRRRRLQAQADRTLLSLPVVVVGNISVGGTGKTPLLIALVAALQARGYRPGVVSRGHGGRPPSLPFDVAPDTNPEHSGDEALLISQLAGCPVVVDPDRLRAVHWLEQQGDCDLILSDDGLQHYRLPRTVELAVVDGARGLGNGLCLPAGPLREPPGRLAEVDAVVINGEPVASLEAALPVSTPVYPMTLRPDRLRPLAGGEPLDPHNWPHSRRIHAVAGIGHPQRFFTTLAQLGFEVIPHAFPDHHGFVAADLAFDDGLPVVMTAKDAVKCRKLASEHHWVLDVSARVPDTLVDDLCARLEAAGWPGRARAARH